MSKRTSYQVDYGNHVARFSDCFEAMSFARRKSRMVDDKDEALFGLVEVSTNTGLIGQYQNGQPTPEFQGHHADVFHWEGRAN